MARPADGFDSWAEEMEHEEAEQKAMLALGQGRGDLFAVASTQQEAGAAAAGSRSKKEKKKKTILSLSEFTTGKHVGHGGKLRPSATSQPEERLSSPLPPTTYDGSSGGGGYGSYRPSSDRFEQHEREIAPPSRADNNDNWGTNKPSRIPGPLPSRPEEPLPSTIRGQMMRRPLPPHDDTNNNEFQGEPGFEMENNRGAPSRADESGNWSTGKRFLPPPPSVKEPMNDPDRWIKREISSHEDDPPQRRRLILNPPSMAPPSEAPSEPSVVPSKPKSNPFGSARPREEILAERGQDPKRVDLEYESKDRDSRPSSSHSHSQSHHSSRPMTPEVVIAASVATAVSSDLPAKPRPKINPFGDAKPRELLLEEKGADWRKMDIEFEHRPIDRDSRPSSSHSSRPETPDIPAKSRPKVNPFGDARPREVLLEEKGMDWRKIDLDLAHRAVNRPETEEERKLKEDIQALKMLGGELNDTQLVGGEMESKQGSLKEEIAAKEKELQKLIWDLNDKVRFSQGVGDRPGSRSGRGGESLLERPNSRSGVGVGVGGRVSVAERPGSRSGRDGGNRSFDFVERPNSRSGRSDFVNSLERLRPERSEHVLMSEDGRQNGFFGRAIPLQSDSHISSRRPTPDIWVSGRDGVGGRSRERW